MSLVDTMYAQMRAAIDREFEQSFFQPMDPESPIAKAMVALSKAYQDETDLLAGKPVTLEDGSIALRMPIPYDRVAILPPVDIGDLNPWNPSIATAGSAESWRRGVGAWK